MIKIEVTHVVKFDTQAEKLVGLIAQAITGAVTEKTTPATDEPTQVEKATTKEPVKEEKKATATEETKNVATKLSYFQHDGTGELVVVRKGESLEFLEKDIFTPLTPSQYNNLKFDQEKAAKEGAEKEAKKASDANDPIDEIENADDEPVTDEAPVLKLEDLRAIAAKFVTAAKQKELKALFGEFEDMDGNACAKLSSIQQEDYASFASRAKEKLAELGVE